MKNLYLIIMLCFGVCSCQNSFYQVSTVKSNDLKKTDNELIFENNDCKISYNLWRNYGNSGFIFYNKTDNNIYLNLAETFYVVNGLASNYFKNRSYSQGMIVTSSQSSSNSISASGSWVLESSIGVTAKKASSVWVNKQIGNLASIEEKETMIVCIPPSSYKIFKEYNVVDQIYRVCGYKKYPKKNEVKELTFEQTTSPIQFKNRITYSIGDNNDPIILENKFYVSSIINYPQKMAIIKKRINTDCMGDIIPAKDISVFKDAAPNKFYIHYTAVQPTTFEKY